MSIETTDGFPAKLASDSPVTKGPKATCNDTKVCGGLETDNEDQTTLAMVEKICYRPLRYIS